MGRMQLLESSDWLLGMHKNFGLHFWGLVSTAFNYSFHLPFLHHKRSQNFLFKIIDDKWVLTDKL